MTDFILWASYTTPHVDYDYVAARFVEFEENELATKALMMAVTGDLVDRVCRQIFPNSRR